MLTQTQILVTAQRLMVGSRVPDEMLTATNHTNDGSYW